MNQGLSTEEMLRRSQEQNKILAEMSREDKVDFLIKADILNPDGKTINRRFRSEKTPTQVIFVDGFDYCGKSTFISNFKKKLENNGRSVAVLKFPTNQLIESQKKEQGESFSFSSIPMSAFRSDIFASVRQALSCDKYDYILCDRGPMSSFVYQYFLKECDELGITSDEGDKEKCIYMYDSAKTLTWKRQIHALQGFMLEMEEKLGIRTDWTDSQVGGEFSHLLIYGDPEKLSYRRTAANKNKDAMDALSYEAFLEKAKLATEGYKRCLHQLGVLLGLSVMGPDLEPLVLSNLEEKEWNQRTIDYLLRYHFMRFER